MSMICVSRRDPLDDAVARSDEVVLQPEFAQERDEHAAERNAARRAELLARSTARRAAAHRTSTRLAAQAHPARPDPSGRRSAPGAAGVSSPRRSVGVVYVLMAWRRSPFGRAAGRALPPRAGDVQALRHRLRDVTTTRRRRIATATGFAAGFRLAATASRSSRRITSLAAPLSAPPGTRTYAAARSPLPAHDGQHPRRPSRLIPRTVACEPIRWMKFSSQRDGRRSFARISTTPSSTYPPNRPCASSGNALEPEAEQVKATRGSRGDGRENSAGSFQELPTSTKRPRHSATRPGGRHRARRRSSPDGSS